MSIPTDASVSLLPPGSQTAPIGPSPSLRSLWEEAVLNFEKSTGKNIRRSPLFNKILYANSVDDIVRVLEAHATSMKTFRAHEQAIRAFLTPLVDVVSRFLNACAERASSSGAVPGGKAIFVAFGLFLKATRGVSEKYDAIDIILWKLEAFLSRLDEHLRSPPSLSANMKKIFVKILIKLLEIFALCTKYLDENLVKRMCNRITRRSVTVEDYVDVLLGRQDVQRVLAELEQMTGGELLATVAETLVSVHEVSVDVKQVDARVQNVELRVQPIPMIVEHQAKMAENMDQAFDALQGSVLDDEAIKAWLNAPEPALNHEHLCNLRKERTCLWFFDATFAEWKNSTNAVYWIYGKPGTGKSVLCSSIIDHLWSDYDAYVVYFYFDFRDCYAVLKRSHSGHRLLLQPTVDLLSKVLEEMLRVRSGTILVIDALDECPELSRERELLPLLHNLVSHDSNHLRLLMTSRPEADIRRVMDRIPSHRLKLHDTDQHSQDLELYISDELRRPEYDMWSEDVKASVKAKLNQMAGGICTRCAVVALWTLKEP
ncbi:hypothetical protein K488DRAFT_69720 [Vararia minispora EC-137]|uniref:Uncharacterized protein n=1 Tax=Vararia minispora EC-137 TaxID=1314806 RepID=A0ACB8QP29_9AGAM|nr:hypothetical protein K488DRAFT_69720 [Vararia minispora EC-137]